MENRNYHTQNTIYLGLVELFWGVGMNLISMSAILPVMMKDLGATHLQIALIPAMASVGVGLPQILSPKFFGRLTKLKFPLIFIHIPVTLPVLVASAMLYNNIGNPVAVILSVWTAHCFSIGLVLPLWLNYMAKILDPAKRGRAFGMIFFSQTVAGAFGVWAASNIYGATFNAGRSSVLFLLAFLAMFFGTFFFFGTKEKSFEGVSHTPFVSIASLIRKYRWLLSMFVFRWILRGCYLIISSFYIVDFMERRSGASSVAISIGTFLLLSQAVSSLILGRLADHINNKIPTIFSSVIFLVSTLLLFFSNFALSYILLAVALGIYVSSEFTTQNNWMMALSEPEDRHAVLAWFGFMNTVPQMIFPFLGGLIMDYYGMRLAASVVSVLLIIAISIMIFLVPAKRATASEEGGAAPSALV
jgi:MFS family permease